MAFDFAPARAVLQARLTDIVPPTGTASVAAYMQDFDQAVALFQEQNTIKPEDYRLAAQMTVDMAKTLITIALAGVAAFVAFIQASEYPALLSVRTLLMAGTFLCLSVSIIFGAVVVSGIWQRGEGRKTSQHDRWSTKPAATPINLQAFLGIVGVILFSLLVLLRSGSQTATGFELSLPGGDRYITSGDIVISGQNLSVVSKKTQDKSQLPPTKSGESDSITISPK